MKKILMGAAIAAMITLTSCGGGVDGKIKKINELAKENTELAENPVENAAKITENAAEMLKIANELKDVELTDQQKEDIIKASRGQLDN